MFQEQTPIPEIADDGKYMYNIFYIHYFDKNIHLYIIIIHYLYCALSNKDILYFFINIISK